VSRLGLALYRKRDNNSPHDISQFLVSPGAEEMSVVTVYTGFRNSEVCIDGNI
jgi:hypothetical protein